MVDEKDKVSKEEVKKQERYELVEIPTATGIAFKDNKTEKVFVQEELLIEIVNKLDKIERGIA